MFVVMKIIINQVNVKLLLIKTSKKILSKKKLCVDCTEDKHRARECKIVQACRICNRKRHTSICDKEQFIIDHKRKQSISKHVVLIKVMGLPVGLFLTPRLSDHISLLS